eukprot:TCONS_00016719-protein
MKIQSTLIPLIVVIPLMSCFVFKDYEDDYPLNVITVWGQNYASKKIGVREPELETLCTNSPYDVIIIGYVTRFFDTINSHTQYPGMDFSIHCDTSNTMNGIQCPDIQNAIETCHRNRKKVILGIGGANALEEFTTFTDGIQAKRFASNVWNLFLGGQTDASIRPFGNEVLDGINIELGHGQSQYMNVFMQRLHEFRTAQAQVQDTLITFSSKCSYPDAYLGPDPGKPLSDALATELIDQIYVHFTQSACCVIGSPGFTASMQKWNMLSAKTKTDLALGFASSRYAVENKNCFNSGNRVAEAIKPWQQRNPYLNGVEIIDNSFDIHNRRRYTFTQSIKTYYRAPEPQPLPEIRPTPPIQIQQPPQPALPSTPYQQQSPTYQQHAPVYQQQMPTYQQPAPIYQQPAPVIQPIVSIPVTPLPPTDPPEEEEEVVEEEPPIDPRPDLVATTLPPEVVQPEPDTETVDTEVIDHELPSPVANETDNLIIDSSTEGKIGHEEEQEETVDEKIEKEHEEVEKEHERIEEEHLEKEEEEPVVLEPVGPEEEEEVLVSTRPPATRAPPLNPDLAAGRIPPNWDFAQAAEIQKKKRAHCKGNFSNGRWQLKCATSRVYHPPPPSPVNKKKGVKITFKGPFKPGYIPNTKAHHNKHRKKKTKKAKHSTKSKKHLNAKRVKLHKHVQKLKHKKTQRKIEPKETFKPSYIPKTQQKRKKKHHRRHRKQKIRHNLQHAKHHIKKFRKRKHDRKNRKTLRKDEKSSFKPKYIPVTKENKEFFRGL